MLLALAIFVAVFLAIVFNLADRAVLVIVGALAMVGTGLISANDAIASIHWEAIGLIFGMFVLVAALTESGFFRWVGLYLLKKTRFDFTKIFIVFCGLAAFLSAFMDSITVIMFIASATIEVCRVLKVSPLPIVIAEICSANIGGSATMVGDPPNVIIGTALNLTFSDFVTHTAPIAMIAFSVNLVVFAVLHRRLFENKHVDFDKTVQEFKDVDAFGAVTDVRLMRMALSVFAFIVTLLVMHDSLDMHVSYVAILGASMVILFARRKMDDLIDKIDWHTIVFLAGLFVMVGGIEKTGLLADFANGLVGLSGGNVLVFAFLLFWVSAALGALLDNIPFAAAMVPVIPALAVQTGVPVDSIAYTTTLGCNIAGNITPIGASANVVGLAIASKKNVEWSWKEYCRESIPMTMASLIVASILMLILLY
jgi:Na+/H+ antiporter NhaD/arsenite permease-like protein